MRKRVPEVTRDYKALLCAGYNCVLTCVHRKKAMEAERLNQIANLLADLQHRTVDLRRYL
jgi:hypothetical protein